MNNTYLNSADISVYPAGYRGNTYTTSKINIEENIVKLNKISKYKNNINSFYLDPFANTYSIISLGGYTFRVLSSNLNTLLIDPEDTSKLYANVFAVINLVTVVIEDELKNTKEIGKILGQYGTTSPAILDADDGTFKGLVFIQLSDETTEEEFLKNNAYAVRITSASGALQYQEFKLSTDEIRDIESDLPINNTFTTTTLNVDTINSTNENVNGTNTSKILLVSSGADVGSTTPAATINGGLVVNKCLNVAGTHGLTDTHPALAVAGGALISKNLKVNQKINNLTISQVKADDGTYVKGINLKDNDITTQTDFTVKSSAVIGDETDTGLLTIKAGKSDENYPSTIVGPANQTAYLAGGEYTDIVTKQYSSDKLANTVVLRDANYNFAAGTITAELDGNAKTASKIKTDKAIGSTKQPVYVASDGTVTAIGYTIETSVPSGAVFIDTGAIAVKVDGSGDAINALSYDADSRTITGTKGYSLPAATSTKLGGVKLGSDTVQTVAANAVSATSDRTYAIQNNSSGQMVVNIPWVNTNTWKQNTVDQEGYVPAPGTANANKVWKTDSTGAPGWRDDANNTYTNGTGLQLSGNSFSLKIATTSMIGGIKSQTTGTTSGRDYVVEVDSSGNAKVNIPWTDTHYNGAVITNAGNPQNSVTVPVNPTICIDTSNGVLYYGTSVNSTTWISLGAFYK